jgi:hypothetical protein
MSDRQTGRRIKMAKWAKPHGIVLVAVVAALIAGCAGRDVGTPKALTDADRPLLAGTWQGTMVGSTGATVPATLRVNSDGTYTIQGGASSSQGKAEIRDGSMQFVATGAAVGRAEATGTGERWGTAVLLDRGDTWAIVGSGQAAAGPYNFEFSKPK